MGMLSLSSAQQMCVCTAQELLIQPIGVPEPPSWEGISLISVLFSQTRAAALELTSAERLRTSLIPEYFRK